MKIDTSKLVDEWNISLSTPDWVTYDLAPRIDALNAEVDRLEARLSNAIEVDWSRAPKWATHIDVYFDGDGSSETLIRTIPRPAPVKREKTAQEKYDELAIYVQTNMSNTKLDKLCRAAGIDLFTEEK